VQVSGTVRGASGQHTIHVLLWDRRGFLRQAVEESFLMPASTVRNALAFPVGQWAIAALEDRNENGVPRSASHYPSNGDGRRFWCGRAHHPFPAPVSVIRRASTA